MATTDPSLARGSWVWVHSKDREELWSFAQIVTRQDTTCEVSFQNGKTAEVEVASLVPANPPDLFDGIPDITKLSFLNDPSLLWNLQQRYSLSDIYTFAGPVLVAINPCQRLPELYGADVSDRYKGGAMEAENNLSPHIFLVAANAFRAMVRESASQSLVISGESGAGKTESTKLAMQYFATLSGGTGIEEQVLESNPILEAFGNAKTLRNHNSSRFGKLISINFNHTHHICGATIDTYLLEKSRVIAHLSGERSYHIFYQLLAGVSPEQRALYHLPPERDPAAAGFRYLGDGAGLDVEKDAADFRDTQHALLDCGISEAQQQQLFRLLAGIMWLGNIEFSAGETATVTTPEPAARAAELLGCDAEALQRSLTVRLIKVKGRDDIVKPLTPEQARDARDCLAKAVYESMFEWLVRRINDKLKAGRKSSGLSISILDIFGFEQFDSNGYDQLLINYANERLQQQFCRHLMALEQQVYREEGLAWQEVAFEDNQAIVELLDVMPALGTKGALGLLPILDGQSKLPKSSDSDFLQQLKDTHAKHPGCRLNPRAPGHFTINHFAGPVQYLAQGFLDRNRDTVPSDLVELLAGSRRELLKEFGSGLQGDGPKAKTTLATRFRQQMDRLVATLEGTGLHFVRCIKPNPALNPGEFNNAVILHQLKCAGILAVAKIYREGLPTRYPLQQFTSRYNVLVPGLDHWKGPQAKESPIQTCQRLLNQFNIPQDDYRIGKTKVFFRAGVLGHVEDQWARLQRVAVRVSAVWKQWRMQVWHKRSRKAAITMQAAIRGRIARKAYGELKRWSDAARAVQSAWRARQARSLLTESRNAIIVLQGCVRCRHARACLKQLRGLRSVQDVAAAKIQAAFRSKRARDSLQRAIQVALERHKANRKFITGDSKGTSSPRPILQLTQPSSRSPSPTNIMDQQPEPVPVTPPQAPTERARSRPVNDLELGLALTTARSILSASNSNHFSSPPLSPRDSLISNSNSAQAEEMAALKAQVEALMQEVENLKTMKRAPSMQPSSSTPSKPVPARLRTLTRHNGASHRHPADGAESEDGVGDGSSDSDDALAGAASVVKFGVYKASRIWNRRHDSLRLGGESPANGKEYAVELYEWTNAMFQRRGAAEHHDLDLVLDLVKEFGRKACIMDDDLVFLLKAENVLGSLHKAEQEIAELEAGFHTWSKEFEANYVAAVAMLPLLAPAQSNDPIADAGWHPIVREVEEELHTRVLKWCSDYERQLALAKLTLHKWRLADPEDEDS